MTGCSRTGPPQAGARRGVRLLVIVAAVQMSACRSEEPRPTAADFGSTEVELTIPACVPTNIEALRIDTVASGLEVPWDVAFLPDGRALITERPGRIRLLRADGVLEEQPWAELDVYAEAEAGLMGIDIAPGSSGGALEVYVAATVRELGSNRVLRLMSGIGRRLIRLVDRERGHSTHLRVLRFTQATGGGVPEIVVTGLPAAPIHAGGALRFGSDGLLYVSSGEAGQPWMAQSDGTTRGKILRYARDGSVPSSNPVPGSPIYARGIRNVQGFGWHPLTNGLLAIDHGPTGLESEGFRTDLDEINAVPAGANLGWPIVAGTTQGGSLTSPLADWRTAIAPSGMAILTEDGTAWTNNVFVTGLRGTSLNRLEVERTPTGLVVTCRERLLHSLYGRLRLARAAPDGSLWIGTSNRDHRGLPRQDSDLILRIHPPAA